MTFTIQQSLSTIHQSSSWELNTRLIVGKAHLRLYLPPRLKKFDVNHTAMIHYKVVIHLLPPYPLSFFSRATNIIIPLWRRRQTTGITAGVISLDLRCRCWPQIIKSKVVISKVLEATTSKHTVTFGFMPGAKKQPAGPDEKTSET